MRQSMLQRLKAARQHNGGFTLIELLIVIVILGVLAGIVVFSVQFITKRGEAAACKTEVKTVEVAVEAFYAQEKAFPQGQTAATPPVAVDSDAGRLQELVNKHYLKQLPTTTMTVNKTTGDVVANPACPT